MPDTQPKPKEKPKEKPKPNRNSRYSVEITDAFVRVIRVAGNGAITNTAEAEITGLPETTGKEYIQVLVKAIKKAARAAKVPLGVGIPCAVVTGGPNVIIRRFTWPEMNESALSLNARQEVIAYLPGDPSLFTVHHRILRRVPKTEMSAPAMDVMVAAIPTDFAAAAIAAVNKCGFYAKRLDVRENARGKLADLFKNNVQVERTDIETPAVPEDDISGMMAKYAAPESYVILDIINPQVNISMYLDGIFYGNRYFAAQSNEDSAYDTDALANEISSVIDYIQYRERGSVMQCVFILGEEENLPGITQSLRDNLDIAVFAANEWISQSIVHKKASERTEIAKYADAYGAALPVAQHLTDINLAPPRHMSTAVRVAIPIAIASVVLGAAVFLAIFIPSGMLVAKRLQIAVLESDLAGYSQAQAELAAVIEEISAVNAQISAEKANAANVQAEMTLLLNRIREVESFYAQYKQAGTVIPAIREVEQRSAGQTFDQVNVTADGAVFITGKATDMEQVADDIRAFKESGKFTDVYTTNLNSIGADETAPDVPAGESSVVFDLFLNLVPGEETE